ncbi:cryptochrome/photolyase family protein [Paraliobacillus sediminis]|uniref:cryptochrome/photolyase family protein n=1 Tax=Paraliobacillus sediminis TaxID=1885916 RepID=UPI000E3B9822|nr:deoxyribodipyrimidine photo-lyase [Paraliobacillus sediminis]
MLEKTVIVWFRKDLRLQDNLALYEATKENNVILVYIHAPDEEDMGMGSAELWWLHHSLKALQEELQNYHVPLILRKGSSQEVLQQIIKETNAAALYFTKRYEPQISERDQQISNLLTKQGIDVQSFHSNLLFTPGTVRNKQGNVYKVFTPFWKQARQQVVEKPVPKPKHITSKLPSDFAVGQLDELGLLSAYPWSDKFNRYWNPGEKGAYTKWRDFSQDAIEHYDDQRDIPSKEGVSKLSPHLAWGEISTRSMWYQSKEKLDLVSNEEGEGDRYKQIESYLRQVVWRDFAYHQLVSYPHVINQPLKDAFRAFPWLKNTEALERWKSGMTGYPLIDAGMRELWETGWMHNRIRMITASFLVKHLLIHWLEGAAWFRDTLVDHDLANNTMGWQWVAGSGYDASPYFRVFNPILQGEKFDKDGDYVRKWVPEIADLPNKYIFSPWTAPEKVLTQLGIKLGQTYPDRIVDHKAARERALMAYYEMKEIKNM